MKTRMTFLIAATAVVFALVAAAGVESRYEAQLSGFAKGKAKYKVKAQGRGVQAELSVEGENLPRNTNYTIIIGKDIVRMTRTNAFGSFDFDERIVGATGLEIADGTPVVVNDATGNTALSGTFH